MKYNDCDWFNYNDVSICNCAEDAFSYKVWIDDKNVNDWDIYETNLFSKLSIFIKIEMNNLIDWISSFTFISFINKNDSKDENEDINLSIVKWWRAFTRLTKIRSKKEPLFF